ncbi:hypothetical protein AB0M46_41190 [Dactylosporangium sp. NPDC051485]|uniref:hypothetical protein n=1 Tax=Dactylosporangium sp. NPDC051485 TaxID=3154846 RepID=UPI00342EF8AA
MTSRPNTPATVNTDPDWAGWRVGGRAGAMVAVTATAASTRPPGAVLEAVRSAASSTR